MRAVIFAGLIFANGSQAATELDVPYIGEPADLALSPREESQLGQEVMRQLLASGLVLEDAQLTHYISQLGHKLARYTDAGDQHFRFFVVRDGGINAFAVPGGYIGINAGLIVASRTESELAGVLAHEIAHVTQRHIARQIDQTSGWDLATTALLIAAVIASASDPEAAQAALGIGLSAAQQQAINFTRAHELEADRLGIRSLSEAGFDPHGMSGFFHHLSQQARLYGDGIPELLRTHPVNTTRIAEAEARAAALPPAGDASDPALYQIMRTRARLLMTELDGEALAYYRGKTRFGGEPSDHYGLAVALSRSRAFDAAAQVFDRLEGDAAIRPQVQLARADMLSNAGRDKAAVSRLQQTYKRYPDYPPAVLSYAQALIATDQAAEARQLLLESELLLTGDTESFRLLAEAARDMQQTAEAHFQMAAYERSRGNYHQAILRLRNALRADQLSSHDRKRLQGRLEQVLAEAPEEQVRQAAEVERRRREDNRY